MRMAVVASIAVAVATLLPFVGSSSTRASDFAASIVLRADRLYADSSKRLTLRI